MNCSRGDAENAVNKHTGEEDSGEFAGSLRVLRASA